MNHLPGGVFVLWKVHYLLQKVVHVLPKVQYHLPKLVLDLRKDKKIAPKG